MEKNIDNFLVNKDSSIKETMQAINRTGLGTAFVVDENKKLFGVVTDGDIRRAILRGIDIEKSIEEIANKKPITVEDKLLRNGVLDLKVKQKIKKKFPNISSPFTLKIPIINEERKVKDIVFVSADGERSYLAAKDKSKFNREEIKKVLLIGGAGYFGSVLSRKLLEKGYRVKVLDNLIYGQQGIKDLVHNQNFEFQKGDIRDISQVIDAIKDVDAVIHLAAIVGDPACKVNPKETLETNYLATKIITEACKYFQINRFIFASTCSVYGESSLPEDKLTEESSLNPVSLYAETKIKCERAILEAVDGNFSPTILRMATLYGLSPNMRFDLAVNLMTAKAIFDKKIIVFGGEQWRPWLHLEDAAQAYIACLEKPIDKIKGEIFNLVSENYRVLEVGQIINSFCPEAELEISKETNDRRNYNVCFDKICQALNYQPKKKIADGVDEIRKTIKNGLIKDYRDFKYRTLLPKN